MRRNHSIEAYEELVHKLRDIIKGVSISTDIICGFCGETEEQFSNTLRAVEKFKFDQIFMFAYSMRDGTHAHRNMKGIKIVFATY